MDVFGDATPLNITIFGKTFSCEILERQMSYSYIDCSFPYKRAMTEFSAQTTSLPFELMIADFFYECTVLLCIFV